MCWSCKKFKALSVDELYELLTLRVGIFVVEQDCAYGELDNKDRHPDTLHLMGRNEQGEIVTYARILPPGLSYPEVSIGRVSVAMPARGAGLARQLMHEAMRQAELHWPDEGIQLGGQAYLQDFYQDLGFKAVSAVYLEDGIAHVDMVYSRAAKQK